MKHFSYVISDVCFKKTITIDSKETQTIQNLKQKISGVIGLNIDQFTISNYSNTTKLYSINDNTTFKLQIINPSDDIKILIPDNKTILIKKCSKMNIASIVIALEKQGIYFSDLIIQKYLKFYLWGIEIPKDGFHLQAVPENIKINVQIKSSFITLKYDQNQFNFSENESVGNVLSLLTRAYENKVNSKFFVTKEKSSEALSLDYQLKTKEKYKIKRSLIINFYFSSGFNDKYKPFNFSVEPKIEFSYLASKIEKHLDIKQPIVLCFKEKTNMVKIDEEITVADIESQIQQKDDKGRIRNILYIDYKKEKIDTNNEQSYTFVFKNKKVNIKIKNGTLLNNELEVVRKVFKIEPRDELEFRIMKNNCVKEDQPIEIFKNENIYIHPKRPRRSGLTHLIFYQTNKSEIIFELEMEEKSMVGDLKKIISKQFETEITNIKILHKRTILFDITPIEHINSTDSIFHVIIQNSSKEKSQTSKEDEKKTTTAATNKKKTSLSKPEIFQYQTNQDDSIEKIKLTTTTTVIEMKEKLSKIYNVSDSKTIKIIFAGKDLLDDIVLHDLSIGTTPLFIYIPPQEDIFLKTAKALKIHKNSYSEYESESTESSEGKTNSEDYTFVFKNKKANIKIKNGTLLNNELEVVRKVFKIEPHDELEFRIMKNNCVKEDQRIEIFKNENIYIHPKRPRRSGLTHLIFYQTNKSEIIFELEMEEKSMVGDLKKIISKQFETEITNIKILYKRTILFAITPIEHINTTDSMLHVIIQNSSKEKSQKLKEDEKKTTTVTTNKKKTGLSKPEIFQYQTNQDDSIEKIKLTTTTTVIEMKEKLSKIYNVSDSKTIKIIFAGKDLLDDIVLHDLSIGTTPLFIYIPPQEDIFLKTAKALKIHDNSYSEYDSDSEYSTQRGKFEVKLDFLDEDLMNKIKPQLNPDNLCGEGGTSIVYRVSCINEFNEYDEKYKKVFLALKILKKSVCLTSPTDDDTKVEIDFEKVRKFMGEYEVILNLSHPNIIRSFGFYYGNETLTPCILLEYYKENVESSIKTLNDVDLVSIIYEICLAMSFVHKNGIIHRNLKPKNILLDKNNHVKICNFGISTLIPTDIQISQSFSFKGTEIFIAPELFNKTKYNEKVDVYSFGVLSHFILTKGVFPVINIYKPSIKLSKTINKNSNILITKCLSMDPKERPSFDEIIKLINNKKMKLIDGIDDSNSSLRSRLNLH